MAVLSLPLMDAAAKGKGEEHGEDTAGDALVYLHHASLKENPRRDGAGAKRPVSDRRIGGVGDEVPWQAENAAAAATAAWGQLEEGAAVRTRNAKRFDDIVLSDGPDSLVGPAKCVAAHSPSSPP